MSNLGNLGNLPETARGPASRVDGDDDDRFVEEMLPGVSRTFALSISLLPRALREPIGVGYLLCRIVDSIEDERSIDWETREALFDAFDAALGSDRSDLLNLERRAREAALGGNDAERKLTAGASGVFRAYRRLPRVQREAIRPHILEMSVGMREYAARTEGRGAFAIDDVADLERYCYYVAGTVGLLLTELFELEVPELGAEARQIVRDNAVAFGLGLQLVNIAKDVADDAERGICFLPADRAEARGVALAEILDPGQRQAGLGLLEEVCDLATRHLDAARTYTLAWPKDEGEAVRLFCAVPLALAFATLREVREGSDSLRPGRNPKISREAVARIVGEAVSGVGDDRALAKLLGGERSTPNGRMERAPRRAESILVALDRATDFLKRTQAPEGFWKGELETNVTMDAEDLLLRQFLGIRTENETRLTARWIRSQQRDDGTWANARGGPAELSTTIEAYLALKLAGDAITEPHMMIAAEWIRAAGGLPKARVFTRIWLALFGLWPWDDLPRLPPEMMFLPPWMPLNVYDFACWARQTVVALTIVMTYRPVRPIVGVDLDELTSGARTPTRETEAPKGWVFRGIDRALRLYERRPIRAMRERALAESERWILQRQEADGSWGGIQPPWVYSLMALSLRGYRLDHPAMRAGLEGLERFTIREDGVRRLEACQSPIWDTAYAMQALADAGMAPNDDILVRGAEWLLTQEVRERGDWSVRRPKLPPSGWAFEFANVNYPDIDDTAEVIIALRRAAHPDLPRTESAIARGVRWLIGMQSTDGGWGAFDADNTRTLVRDIPFCDFGEVIDPPTADVTAHAVEVLCGEGLIGHPATRAGVTWLLDNQEDDGSWFGRWGVNYVYGTGGVLMALAEAEVDPHDEAVRNAVCWLEEKQNDDGGWGEDVRSYEDRAWAGRGPSTPSQTAWALLGLLAAGETGNAVTRGIDFLVAHQRSDGGWDEAAFTGTGFPGAFYINYHLYRQVFPTMALGRWARSQALIMDPPRPAPGLVQLRV